MKISLDEWLDILSNTAEEVYNRFSDDGKISISDAIYLFCFVLKAVAKAAKTN